MGMVLAGGSGMRNLRAPVSRFQGARGKRRCFSPGAAARHSQSARVHTDSCFPNPCFQIFPTSAARRKPLAEIRKKSRLQPAEVKTQKFQKKKWSKISGKKNLTSAARRVFTAYSVSRQLPINTLI